MNSSFSSQGRGASPPPRLTAPRPPGSPSRGSWVLSWGSLWCLRSAHLSRRTPTGMWFTGGPTRSARGWPGWDGTDSGGQHLCAQNRVGAPAGRGSVPLASRASGQDDEGPEGRVRPRSAFLEQVWASESQCVGSYFPAAHMNSPTRRERRLLTVLSITDGSIRKLQTRGQRDRAEP